MEYEKSRVLRCLFGTRSTRSSELQHLRGALRVGGSFAHVMHADLYPPCNENMHLSIAYHRNKCR